MMKSWPVRSALTVMLFSLAMRPAPAREAAAHPRPAARPVATPADVEVIRAVLSGKLPAKVFVLDDGTAQQLYSLGWYMHAVRADKKQKTFPEEAVRDLIRSARRSATLPAQLANDRLIVTDSKRLDAVFRRGFWGAFHKKFPTAAGTASVSLPGFDARKEAAVIYFSRATGGKSGRSSLVALKRVGPSWQVVDEMILEVF